MVKKTQTDAGEEPSPSEMEKMDKLISEAMRSLGWLMPRTDEEVRLAELAMQAAQEEEQARRIEEEEWPEILFERDESPEFTAYKEPSCLLKAEPVVPKKSRISLAVMPLFATSDASHHVESRIFLDFSDQLIRKLSAAGFNTIRPASSSRMFTTPGTRAQAGPSLHVDYILDASVVETRPAFCANVSLVRVYDGQLMLQTTYRANARDDVIHAESSLAEEVALVFQPNLTAEQRRHLTKCLTTNVDAYFEFKVGRDCFNQFNEAGLQAAVGHFEKAFQLDPKFADAYACASETLIWLAQLGIGYQRKTSAELFNLAREYADRALALGSNIANAYAAKGFINIFFEPDWRAAAGDFQKALALDVNCFAAHVGWAELLCAQGQFPEALAEIDLALVIDPTSLICNVVKGIIFYEARQWMQSLKQFEDTLELHNHLSKKFSDTYAASPDTIFYGLSLCYVQLGLLKKAQKAATLATRCARGHPTKLALRAYVYALAGKKDAALAILKRLLEQHQEDCISFHLALIYIALFEKNQEHAAEYKDKAFQYLLAACEKQDCWRFLLRVDPRLDPLRLDKGFAALVQNSLDAF